MAIKKEVSPVWDINKDKLIKKFPRSFTLGNPIPGKPFCEHCWIALSDGELVGMAWLTGMPDNFYEVSIGVDDRFHGRGIATDLIKMIQSFCINADIAGLVGVVEPSNEDYLKAVFRILEKCDFLEESTSSRIWYSNDELHSFYKMSGK